MEGDEPKKFSYKGLLKLKFTDFSGSDKPITKFTSYIYKDGNILKIGIPLHKES